MKEKTKNHNESIHLSFKNHLNSWINYFMVVCYHFEDAAVEHKYNPITLMDCNSFLWAPEEVKSMSRWLSHPTGYGQERMKAGLQRASIGNKFIFFLLSA